MNPEGIAPSAAPPNALKVWVTSAGTDILIEIPGRLGPVILKRNFTTAGVAEVFTLLGRHRADIERIGTPDAYLKPSKEPGTHNQRAAAEKILYELGLIK